MAASALFYTIIHPILDDIKKKKKSCYELTIIIKPVRSSPVTQKLLFKSEQTQAQIKKKWFTSVLHFDRHTVPMVYKFLAIMNSFRAKNNNKCPVNQLLISSVLSP